jgi:hypothetical protein
LALGSALYGNSILTDTLTITGTDITPAMNGFEYQAIFTNPIGEATISSAVTLVVDDPPTITGNPANATVTAGGTVTFTASASGNPTPNVQWKYSSNGNSFVTMVDGTAAFGTVSGTKTDTLTISNASAALNGYKFEAVFTNFATSPPGRQCHHWVYHHLHRWHCRHRY